MPARCVKCGRSLGPLESFCRNCGAAARTDAAPGPTGNTDPFAQLDASLRGSTIPTLPTGAPLYSPPARPSVDRRLIAAVLLLVGAFCAMIFFAVSANQGQSSEEAARSEPIPAVTGAAVSVTAAPSAAPDRGEASRSTTNSPTVDPGLSRAESPPPANDLPESQRQAAAAPPPPARAIESPANASGPQSVIARVKASTVLILCQLPDGVASGTGFVVGPHQIGTCAHVLAGAQEIVVLFADGNHTGATVQSSDERADVAVLNCSASLPPALPLGRYADVREGDEVAVTGYPEFFSLTQFGLAPEASTTRGYVSAKRERETENGVVPEIQIDASVNHGNSGGPVYRTGDGTVIALAAATVSNTQGLNFATPIDALRRLIGE